MEPHAPPVAAELVDRTVFARPEEESSGHDGRGVVGVPTAERPGIAPEKRRFAVVEQVERQRAEPLGAGDALPDVEQTVQARIERRSALDRIVGLQGQTRRTAAGEIDEIDLAAQRADDDLLAREVVRQCRREGPHAPRERVGPADVERLAGPPRTAAPAAVVGLAAVEIGREHPVDRHRRRTSRHPPAEPGVAQGRTAEHEDPRSRRIKVAQPVQRPVDGRIAPLHLVSEAPNRSIDRIGQRQHGIVRHRPRARPGHERKVEPRNADLGTAGGQQHRKTAADKQRTSFHLSESELSPLHDLSPDGGAATAVTSR